MRYIFLAMLAALFATHSRAYRYTDDFNLGIYWSSLPIPLVKIASNSQEGSLLASVVERAEQEWENVVGGDLWNVEPLFRIGSPLQENTIRWSNQFGTETGLSPETTLAVTIRYRTGTHFDHFEIILNGENPLLRSNSGDILYRTMLHELGHILGIGHSDRAPAVMEAVLTGNTRLTIDDQEAAHAVYHETIRRQDVGFVSSLATSDREQNASVACGSIGQNLPPGGGLKQMLLGFMAILVISLGKKLPLSKQYEA